MKNREDMGAGRKDKTKRLGEAVRRRRKALGLTQKGLAEFAGCGVVYVYMLESGKATIRMDKLMDVLAVLGLGLKLVEGKEGLVIDEGLV